MVPYADMANSTMDKNNRPFSFVYDDNRGGFVVVATNDVARGDEVFLNYGKKENGELFFYYGFIDRGNFYPTIYRCEVRLDENDWQYSEKLKKLCIDAQRKFFFKLKTEFLNYQTTSLFSFMRFLVYNGDLNLLENYAYPELMNDGGETKETGLKFLRIISLENESKVLDKLKKMSENYLAAYPNTIEEDIQILESDEK